MSGPILDKINLWREADKGFKTRFSRDARQSVVDRDDIASSVVTDKLNRGGVVQKIRYNRYPSINVDHDRVFAGEIEGGVEDAESMLLEMGARNNPTAYVEVTSKNGPDDGSYSKLLITEDGGRLDTPRLRINPSFFRRIKDQIHIVMWEREDTVEFGAHREQHAWLQPLRHLAINDSNARVGVRMFRNMWYDEFGEELGGKDLINWDTTH